jgi:hypothetical protein
MKILRCYTWLGDGSDNLKITSIHYCFGEKNLGYRSPSFLVYSPGKDSYRYELQGGFLDIFRPSEEYDISNDKGSFPLHMGHRLKFAEDKSIPLPNKSEMPTRLRHALTLVFTDNFIQQKLWYEWFKFDN